MRNSYNQATFDAIPLSRRVKTHYLRRYNSLCERNGISYAQQYFKNMRLAFMRYVSRESTLDDLLEELTAHRVRRDPSLRYLVNAAKGQPHLVLEFLKFPTGDPRVSGNADETLKDLVDELSLHNLGTERERDALMSRTLESLRQMAKDPDRRPGLADAFAPLSRRAIARMGDDLVATRGLHVHPGDYADHTKVGDTWYSPQFEEDRENAKRHAVAVSTEWPVGVIHLVKKGVDDFRAVAVPNRFLQLQLAPFATWLTNNVRRVRTDCTFNQALGDKDIQGWVNSADVCPYGVDIHHATNTLPFRHGQVLVEALFAQQWAELRAMDLPVERLVFTKELHNGKWDLRTDRVQDTVNALNLTKEAWRNFRQMSDGLWKVEGHGHVRFLTGQPLGTWGSFSVLTLQNALYAEMAIQFAAEQIRKQLPGLEGKARSRALNMLWDLSNNVQYYILGDDVVFKHASVARVYIQILQGYKVPLSLHKSFKGCMVEFAGKVFTRNNQPHYLTDQTLLTKNNVLEWSQATGIPVYWENLAPSLRKQLEKSVRRTAPEILGRAGMSFSESWMAHLPAAFDRAVDSLKGSSTAHLARDSQQHRSGWDALFALVREEVRLPLARERETYSGYLKVRHQGQVELYSVPQIAHLEQRLVDKVREGLDRSGRPKWKDSKWVTDTTDVQLAAAVAAHVLYMEEKRTPKRSD